MNSQPNSAQDWAPVEPGQLHDLSTKLRRPRASSVAKSAAFAAGVCAVAVIAIGLALGRGGDQPAPIACTDVVPHLAAYAQGECPEPLAEQIAWHLKSCPMCRQHLAKLQEEQAQAAASPERWIAQVLASLWQ